MSIDKLFPALVECFGIILAGIITGSQAKGLGNFVSRFALPALLFKNMVLLDFGDVIWAFLWSILIAKRPPLHIANRPLSPLIIKPWRLPAATF
ncbi:hypothetical protein CRUP_007157 [Coryphaenoides rupestris]|nr:hypothetical protein CRUP_007157 [Coryphaenoides rupestris]